MTPSQAKAEVFLAAFSTLQPSERQLVIKKLITEKSIREDLIDFATAEKRKGEKSRSLLKVAAEFNKKKK